MDKGRIDIAINERGIDSVVRAIEDVAAASQALSPKLAMSLRGAALRVRVNTDKLVKDVAVKALDVVVHRTPHDTGQARANWQVSISNSSPAAEQLIGEVDYEGDATVAKGTSIIMSSKRAPGETIFISNALDYIVPLDRGHSQQAPNGMVAQAIQAAQSVASNKRVLVK